MNKTLAFFLALLMTTVSLAGCMGGTSDEDENNDSIPISHQYSDVVMKVSHDGVVYEFTIQLNHSAAPMHAENFVAHVEAGNYDGTIFHRIIDDFMIQGGDYTNGDGTGGQASIFYGYCNGQSAEESSCDPSQWTVPDEAENGLNHLPCTISMAKTSAPNTGGSQFFIIPEDSTPTWLDGVHTVFGSITSGCGDITTISNVETGSGDKPTIDVMIVSATHGTLYEEITLIPAPPERCDLLARTTEGDKVRILDSGGGLFYDFSNCDFSNADFSRIDFRWVDFSNSTFTNTDFSNSSFMSTIFNNANLEGADFSHTLLASVWLLETNLESTTFENANIQRVFATGSNLAEVDLSSVTLLYSKFDNLEVCPSNLPTEWTCAGKTMFGPWSDFTSTDLSGIDFGTANLTNSYFNGANLSNSIMEGATLKGIRGVDVAACPLTMPDEWNCINQNLIGPSAELLYADLVNANLSGLNLTSVSITFSDLTGADFSNSNLENAGFAGVLIHNTTFTGANLDNFRGFILFDCPLTIVTDWICYDAGYNHSFETYTQGQFVGDNSGHTGSYTTLMGPGASISNFNLGSNYDFSNLNFTGATFVNSDFTGANFTSTNIDDTVWKNTLCPNGKNSEEFGQSCEGQLDP